MKRRKRVSRKADDGVMIYVHRDDRARLWALGRRDRRSIKGQIGAVLDDWCRDAGVDSDSLIQEYDDGKG